MATPVLVSKALDLFLQDICNKTYDIVVKKGSKKMCGSHLKQCVSIHSEFDFLRETLARVPQTGNDDEERMEDEAAGDLEDDDESANEMEDAPPVRSSDKRSRDTAHEDSRRHTESLASPPPEKRKRGRPRADEAATVSPSTANPSKKEKEKKGKRSLDATAEAQTVLSVAEGNAGGVATGHDAKRKRGLDSQSPSVHDDLAPKAVEFGASRLEAKGGASSLTKTEPPGGLGARSGVPFWLKSETNKIQMEAWEREKMGMRSNTQSGEDSIKAGHKAVKVKVIPPADPALANDRKGNNVKPSKAKLEDSQVNSDLNLVKPDSKGLPQRQAKLAETSPQEQATEFVPSSASRVPKSSSFGLDNSEPGSTPGSHRKRSDEEGTPLDSVQTGQMKADRPTQLYESNLSVNDAHPFFTKLANPVQVSRNEKNIAYTFSVERTDRAEEPRGFDLNESSTDLERPSNNNPRDFDLNDDRAELADEQYTTHMLLPPKPRAAPLDFDLNMDLHEADVDDDERNFVNAKEGQHVYGESNGTTGSVPSAVSELELGLSPQQPSASRLDFKMLGEEPEQEQPPQQEQHQKQQQQHEQEQMQKQDLQEEEQEQQLQHRDHELQEVEQTAAQRQADEPAGAGGSKECTVKEGVEASARAVGSTETPGQSKGQRTSWTGIAAEDDDYDCDDE
eukprot:TRINITY_DN32709_c0_g1_i1.p1 TRINITY_DN32709_c0_g1~~TRINITY_DN32709_c0_g1_i1.p1  ORF type:complete len:720 (+),score=153.01 TRINITY_DN32709_c0_g1_i1:128-2161(+)